MLNSNKFYSVVITHNSPDRTLEGFPMVANCPEDLNLNFSSEWGSPMLLDSVGDNVNVGMQAISGLALNSRTISPRSWNGNGPLSITLPLIFRAERDAYQEVVLPIKNLAMLVTPTLKTTGVVIVPGPRPFKIGEKNVGEKVTVSIGTYVTYDDIVVKDVSIEQKLLFDRRGYPMLATVTIQFETYNSPVAGDLDRWF